MGRPRALKPGKSKTLPSKSLPDPVSSDEEVCYLSDMGAEEESADVAQVAAVAKTAAWKNKSGKWWKEPRLQRLTGRIKDAKAHTSWELKERQREKRKAVKELKDELINTRREARSAKAARRRENQERRQANERKAEIVQKVKSVHKLKRMKRRLLRTVEKRDTGNEGTAGPAFE